MKKKIIWVNGCFDIIHTGHIELFKFAKNLGLYLFVGIDSDKRVKKLKGEGRPINNQDDRKKILESIRYIDQVFIFDTPQEMEDIIKKNNIGSIVIGEEYKDKKITGSSICEVVFFPRINGISSTHIIDSFK
jgi:rfaE bifunctional protein nucleotidyltransferase chain/domain